MVRLLDRAGLSRLSRSLALLPLVVHKGVQGARRLDDEHGGTDRAASRARQWGAAWLERHGSMEAWFNRPGAGQLWLGPEAAPRWARRAASALDLACAESVLAGTIPLIGAEPVTGNPPAWRRDGYTGREWPLLAAGRIPLMRGDGSDIRTVWELSRCYHFAILAKAFWRTGEPRFVAAFQGHAESWQSDNPPGLGPNWASPMDAAIRGANWALAAVLFARAPGLPRTFWASYLANLRLTARHVSRHLEWHPHFRGNHYISNAVGLVYIGGLFRDDPEGNRWLRKGAAILESEMAYQVHPDGVSFEASVGYHRLVTEFFSWGGAVVRRNLPGALSPAYWEKLALMRRFLELYLDAEGRAPLIGDADDGRLHHLCAAAAQNPRRHRLGLPAIGRPQPATSAAFPNGGFYILAVGRDRCMVRCGPVGLAGAGSHDHNDQLSYELVLDGREAITDSGTFAYTRDLAARYAFRSVAAHNAIQLGMEEPNPITIGRPWRILADRTRSTCLFWESGPGGTHFEGRHQGYRHRPSRALVRRRIGVDARSGAWEIGDQLEGSGSELVTWRLHLAPGRVTVETVAEGSWSFRHDSVPGRRFTIRAPAGFTLEWSESPWSERYGSIVSRPMVLLQGQVELPVVITLGITPDLRVRT